MRLLGIKGFYLIADLHGISLSEFTTTDIGNGACMHVLSGHVRIRIKLDVSFKCLSLKYYLITMHEQSAKIIPPFSRIDELI